MFKENVVYKYVVYKLFKEGKAIIFISKYLYLLILPISAYHLYQAHSKKKVVERT